MTTVSMNGFRPSDTKACNHMAFDRQREAGHRAVCEECAGCGERELAGADKAARRLDAFDAAVAAPRGCP